MNPVRDLDLAAFISPDRRDLLRRLALGAGIVFTECATARMLWAKPVFSADPFSLGVASGDPAVDGFVLWTRLAPQPFEAGSGMPRQAVEVTWHLAADEGMATLLRSGTALARPEGNHSVHVEIGGLEAGRDYFYRFRAGDVFSPVGRAKTLPRPGAEGTVRFASAGCQRYEDGFFTAWRRIAEERFDFVVHYGDYIYEYASPADPNSRRIPLTRQMPVLQKKCLTLNDFRLRYSLYKADPDLQAAHHSAPFIVSFDDHEVENNWAGFSSEFEGVSRAAFALRREAAFRAWYENMPLRRAQMPKGPDILAYRRLTIGNLMDLDVLDTRQYRDPQPCGDGWKVCPEAKQAHRTMLGQAQERWLADGFRARTPVWTVLAQQVPFAHTRRKPDDPATSMDKWDSAEAARERILGMATAAKRGNLVVLSGDVHEHRAGHVAQQNSDRPQGVEFVATSISSGGDGRASTKAGAALLAANPALLFHNAQRGYVRHHVSATQWQADFRVLDAVSEKDAPAKTARSFMVAAGKPALQAI